MKGMIFVFRCDLILLLLTALTNYSMGIEVCPEGWSYYNSSGFCYYVSEQYAMYGRAMLECGKMNASLMKVNYVADMDFARDLVLRLRCTAADKCRTFWMGLEYLSFNHNEQLKLWTWSNGLNVTGPNDTGSYRSLTDGSICAAFQINAAQTSSYFVRQSCDIPYRYICRKNCPLGSTEFPLARMCYKLVPGDFTWTEARDLCYLRSYDTYSVAVRTPEESKAVATFLTTFQELNPALCGGRGKDGGRYWTVGRRRNPNDGCDSYFEWRTQGPAPQVVYFENFYQGYSDNCVNDCIFMASGHQYEWVRDNCANTACAVCETKTYSYS